MHGIVGGTADHDLAQERDVADAAGHHDLRAGRGIDNPPHAARISAGALTGTCEIDVDIGHGTTDGIDHGPHEHVGAGVGARGPGAGLGLGQRGAHQQAQRRAEQDHRAGHASKVRRGPRGDQSHREPRPPVGTKNAARHAPGGVFSVAGRGSTGHDPAGQVSPQAGR